MTYIFAFNPPGDSNPRRSKEGLVEEPRPGDPSTAGLESLRDAAQPFERHVLKHVHLQVCSGHCLPLAVRG
jgi:hypothetical protein